MAKIKMVLEDDFGNQISSTSYDLGSSLNTLNKIETAITSVSGEMLGNVTSGILEAEQLDFIKKTDINSTEHTA